MADTRPPSTRSGTRTDRDALLDLNRPNPARVFDAIHGGKDAYLIDRHVADKLIVNNTFRVAVTQARAFMLRAVEHLVGNYGITQIVELGCGYPNTPQVHDVAINQNPNARTLYLDHDPYVAAHALALMTGPNSEFATADLTDPASIAEHLATTLHISTPIAVCLSGTAEFLPDAPALVASLLQHLPDESWLVFTHTAADLHDSDIDTAVETLASAGIRYRPRDRDEVEQMLAPLLLLDPGLVTADLWRPDHNNDDECLAGFGVWPRPTVCSYAAVGKLHRR
ncbi:hypothetical protein NN3_00680 [Nocardia neocaledoniensis NBRC 108232]|uniref:S-adenosyl methyltransferase n=1 Tax=Nocardia neocaledoniensis TaxID=236511 RepID=A0A317NHT0_9NOCA|nr:SAM-dependent methyltransferase [Nocardia neocaledoniensis]PWV74443.1 S-adenosyl methyltransferase [Nocardia neocaledoniensis]GEM29061.1 hypothetical protein NN3_00680 [Nocardia neocaledoniensis NBRC 108232]